jgi:hypothetical protein
MGLTDFISSTACSVQYLQEETCKGTDEALTAKRALSVVRTLHYYRHRPCAISKFCVSSLSANACMSVLIYSERTGHAILMTRIQRQAGWRGPEPSPQRQSSTWGRTHRRCTMRAEKGLPGSTGQGRSRLRQSRRRCSRFLGRCRPPSEQGSSHARVRACIWGLRHATAAHGRSCAMQKSHVYK